MTRELLIPTMEIPYGKIVKYKELCKIFGIEYKRGGYVVRNIGRIMDEYNLDTSVKGIYIILNKLSVPRFEEKFENEYSGFCVSYADKSKSGIYIIQENNTVYIGQTKNFYNRFSRHKGGYSKNDNKTKKLLKLGATFKIIEVENDAIKRLTKEAEYVNKYISDGYDVLNTTKVLYKGKKEKVFIRKNNIVSKKKRHRKTNTPKTIKNTKCNKDKISTVIIKEPRFGITFNKSDLDKITKLLSDNNIEFKPHKFRDKKEPPITKQ